MKKKQTGDVSLIVVMMVGMMAGMVLLANHGMGMMGHGVHETHEPPAPAAATANAGQAPDQNTAQAQRKILYYRNPMGLPDTSPVPKKDSMGMAYLPVYEGQEDAASGETRTAKPDHPQPQTEQGGTARTTP